jgi:hypothetical protein
MATVSMSEIAASLAEIFDDEITSQINRATVLLQVLPVANGPAGQNIKWSVRFGTATGGARAEGADVVTFNNDAKVPATLDYGTYDDAFAMTGKSMALALNTRNPSELSNLFLDELGDCVERLAKGVAIDLYSGTGATDHIHGLVATGGAIMDSGTYAGIDRAVRTQWRGTIMSNSGVGRALTFDLMREMRRRIYQASGLKPDLIVTTPEIHEKYGKLFGQQRRYITEITMRGSTIKLDGGYQMLEFDGIPVLEDVDCTTGDMIFLNTRYVRVLQVPSEPNEVNQSMAVVGLAGTPEEQLGQPSQKLQAPQLVRGDPGHQPRAVMRPLGA